MTDRAAEIVEFWIGPAADDAAEAKARGKLWYQSTPESDEDLRKKFGADLAAAEAGNLDGWQASATGSLALVILLDQFSRNLYRGTARAFANDNHALSVALGAIGTGLDREMSLIGRAFLYHPFEHSEDIAIQEKSVLLFTKLAGDASGDFKEQMEGFLAYAVEHCEVVRKFGRFPHRNRVLGRGDTPEETAYLDAGAKRYGQ